MDQNTPQGRKSPLPWLLGVLLIVILGVVLWWYLKPASPTNTPSPANTNAILNTSGSTNSNSSPTANANTVDTAAWEEYSNTDFGLSFRHPVDWRARQDGNVVSLVPDDIHDAVFTVVKIQGDLQDVQDHINGGQNREVTRVVPTVFANHSGSLITVTQTYVNQTLTMLALPLGQHSLLMDYRANEDTGFPISLDLQRVVDAVLSTMTFP